MSTRSAPICQYRVPLGNLCFRQRRPSRTAARFPFRPCACPPAVRIPASRPRHAAQTGWLLCLVGLACSWSSAGMVYLSGYAQVTQESYRHTKLMGQLKQETRNSSRRNN